MRVPALVQDQDHCLVIGGKISDNRCNYYSANNSFNSSCRGCTSKARRCPACKEQFADESLQGDVHPFKGLCKFHLKKGRGAIRPGSTGKSSVPLPVPPAKNEGEAQVPEKKVPNKSSELILMGTEPTPDEVAYVARRLKTCTTQLVLQIAKCIYYYDLRSNKALAEKLNRTEVDIGVTLARFWNSLSFRVICGNTKQVGRFRRVTLGMAFGLLSENQKLKT